MTGFKTLFAAVCFLSATVHAADEKKEAKEKGAAVVGHCEKMIADGAEEDIEAKDKSDCKTKGGKWNKHAKGDQEHGSAGHKH